METVPKTQSSVLAYFLILLSFFILLFFTRNIFSELQVSLDTKETLAQELLAKQEELTKLNQIQALLAQEDSVEMKAIQGYLWTFSDADILEYIYSYAQKVNLTNDRIIIRDLSLGEGGVSDIGFETATVNLSAIFSSEETLFSFLNYMIAEDGKYRFYISQFDYPMNNVTGNIQASIPLTLYYKK